MIVHINHLEPRYSPPDLRLGHPSGVLPVAALVERDASGATVARQVTVYRTARRLIEGFVRVPAGRPT